MLAHLAAFGRQGSRLSGRRRSLSAPHKSCALRFLCSSKSCTSNNVSSPRTQLGPDSILPHLPVSSHSKNLTSICSRLSRRRLSPRTNTELGGRRNFFSTETGGGGASSASALEAANNAARQAQLAYANAISTAKSNALFRKLFFITVPAGAFGGVAFFYWYTQERHEVKVQKAVIDPHLARKLEDLKPADTASHPYSSRSWVWKLFFIIARTAQLLWIWTPVICIAPVAALTGHKGLRKYLIKLLVKTTKRAGCSFVKFGQWVSMRPDIFAADIVAAMKHLMTDAPAHSYAETRRIIQESFGLSIEDLFDNFEAVPVASGSVAQVHRATLRPHQSPSGKPIVVAVKVLHPETLDETYIDIQIMTWVIKRLPIVTAPLSGRDFAKNISRQTDCRWEAYNLSQFQCNFIQEIANGSIKVPQVVTGLVRPSVLVETWDDGRLITNAFDQDEELDAEVARAAGLSPQSESTDVIRGVSTSSGSEKVVQANTVDPGPPQHAVPTAARDGGPPVDMSLRKKLALRLFDTSLKMFLRDNFIHADLHAGNIMFSTRPSKVPGSAKEIECLTLLDAGLTAQLDEATRPVFNTFLIAMCRLEAQTISECLVKFNRRQEARPRSERDMQKLERMVQSIIDTYADEDGRSAQDGGPVNVGYVMGGIMHQLSKHHIKLKGDVAFSVCVISLVEGLIRQLNPSFDMFEAAMPYFSKYKLIDSIQLVETRVEEKKRLRKGKQQRLVQNPDSLNSMAPAATMALPSKTH